MDALPRRLAPRPPPWLALSVLLHVLGLAALYLMGPRHVTPSAPRPVEQARIQESLAKAQRVRMQKHLRQLDEMAKAMAASAEMPMPELTALDNRASAEALKERAEQLTARIRQADQQERAKELARLLKTTPEKALAQIKAEDQKRWPALPPNTPPQVAMERLQAQARQALLRQEQRQQQRNEGSQVTLQNASGGAGKQGSAVERAAAAPGGAGGGNSNNGNNGGGLPTGSAGTFNDPRVYTGMTGPQAVDASTLKLGFGRALGSGGSYATRVYLNSWYIAGPFAGNSAASLNEPQAPEIGVDLDATYAGLGGRPLRWVYVNAASYPLIPQPRAENAVYYAYTELRVDSAQDVVLEIGADDDSKLWLNDELVWISGSGDKPWYRQPFYNLKRDVADLNLVEGTRRVRLQAGRNTLLFKLYNGIDLMFFSVVVTPANGN